MTTGARIKKIVDKYFGVYKRLSADEKFKDKASELAKHDQGLKAWAILVDLWMMKFIYEQAINDLTARIIADEGKSVPAL